MYAAVVTTWWLPFCTSASASSFSSLRLLLSVDTMQTVLSPFPRTPKVVQVAQILVTRKHNAWLGGKDPQRGKKHTTSAHNSVPRQIDPPAFLGSTALGALRLHCSALLCSACFCAMYTVMKTVRADRDATQKITVLGGYRDWET